MNIRMWGTSLLMFLSTVSAVGQTANRYLKAPLPGEMGGVRVVVGTWFWQPGKREPLFPLVEEFLLASFSFF